MISVLSIAFLNINDEIKEKELYENVENCKKKEVDFSLVESRVFFVHESSSLSFLFGLNNVFRRVYVDYSKGNFIIEI